MSTMPLWNDAAPTQTRTQAPRHNGTPTSIEAARAMTPKKRSELQQRIIDRLHMTAFMGQTREELARDLDVPLDTINARINELGRAGIVKALAKTRRLRSGREGLVFVLADDVGQRPLAEWPTRRSETWKQRAIKAEAELQRIKRGAS